MLCCPRCSAVLRHVPGLQQVGEPFMQSDEQGSFMICLGCAARVPWQDDDEDESDFDVGGGAVPA